jgi:hypothetical protein
MEGNKIKINHFDALVIFGGGPLVLQFAKEAIIRDIKVYIFLAPRHSSEVINRKTGETLGQLLTVQQLTWYTEKDINTSNDLANILISHEECLGIGIGETYTFAKHTIDRFHNHLFDFMVIPLPQFRGGAHFTWQILRKNRIGCWNIQVINDEMVPGVYDSGEIIKSKEYVLPPSTRIPQDYFEMAECEAIILFREFIAEILSGKEFQPVPLEEKFSTYFPRLFTLKHGFIDWSWSTDEIETFICAFDEPYIGSSTFINGKRVFIRCCEADYSEGKFHPFMSGLIFRIAYGVIYIASNDGALVVHDIRDQDGRDMIPLLKPGLRFYTPKKFLEESMMFDAEYSSEGIVKDRKP